MSRYSTEYSLVSNDVPLALVQGVQDNIKGHQ
jgi:hypothetical protein